MGIWHYLAVVAPALPRGVRTVVYASGGARVLLLSCFFGRRCEQTAEETTRQLLDFQFVLLGGGGIIPTTTAIDLSFMLLVAASSVR